MSNVTPTARGAQWAGGLTLLTLAVGAGGVGLALNVRHGLEAGAAQAITYGLADIAKITIPIIAGWIGWNSHLRITAAVCVAVSLWCATNAWLDYNGRRSIDAQQQTVNADTARAELARIRTELAAIAETGSPAALLAAARLQSDTAASEAKNGGCLKRCSDAQKAAAELTERAGKAERKAKLEGELAAAKAKAEAAKPAVEARSTGLVDAVLFLALVELLVWLSPLGIALIKAAREARPDDPAPTPKPAAEAETPAPAPTSRPKSGSAAYYLDRLRRDHPELAARVHRGELTVNAASIAAGLRQAKKLKRPAVVTADNVNAHLARIASRARKKERA